MEAKADYVSTAEPSTFHILKQHFTKDQLKHLAPRRNNKDYDLLMKQLSDVLINAEGRTIEEMTPLLNACTEAIFRLPQLKGGNNHFGRRNPDQGLRVDLNIRCMGKDILIDTAKVQTR